MTDINGPRLTALEAQALAQTRPVPFRIRFHSKVARRLTLGAMPTITLWKTVYTIDGDMLVEVFFHEDEHVIQFSEHRFTFPILYFWAAVVQDGSNAANRWENRARMAALRGLREWKITHTKVEFKE